jgi:hypothetical protein
VTDLATKGGSLTHPSTMKPVLALEQRNKCTSEYIIQAPGTQYDVYRSAQFDDAVAIDNSLDRSIDCAHDFFLISERGSPSIQKFCSTTDWEKTNHTITEAQLGIYHRCTPNFVEHSLFDLNLVPWLIIGLSGLALGLGAVLLYRQTKTICTLYKAGNFVGPKMTKAVISYFLARAGILLGVVAAHVGLGALDNPEQMGETSLKFKEFLRKIPINIHQDR